LQKAGVSPITPAHGPKTLSVVVIVVVVIVVVVIVVVVIVVVGMVLD
jgi:hypothetical protein